MAAVQPLVSVVIPYYDHGRHLHQTVSSCLRAYRGPLEIILVNDGSVEPKAPHYIETAAALSPAVKVITQRNQGLSAARNAGIRAASGAFVQLLDSDDMIVPGKIDAQVEHFQTQPSLDVSLTNYLLTDPSGTSFWRDGDPITRFDFTREDFLLRWERGFSIPIHCALFKRQVFNDAPFETSLIGKEDWVFWCRLALANRLMSYVPIFGAIYRQHASSMSKSFQKMSDSFLAASHLIEAQLSGDEAARFRRASLDWLDTFYKPRIGNDATQPGAAQSRAEDATAESPVSTSWADAPNCLKHGAATPTISVIVPVYNHYRYLPECLNSILAQHVDQPIEVIVIDDASPDPRVSPLLQSFAKLSPNIRLITNAANLGIAETQNKAAAEARGTFLAFLDCDDRLEEKALAAVLQTLDAETDYLFTDRTDIDAEGKRLRVARYGGYPNIKPSGDIRSDLMDGMVASHLKVIRRETYLSAGGFDPAFGGVQDWELALKMAQRGARFRYLPQALYLHRIHTGSVTGEDSVRQFWLSNVVRRRFAGPALRPNLTEANALLAVRASLRNGLRDAKDVAIFRDAQHVSAERLKAAWRAGKACIYAASSGAGARELNIVREYNSYFDAILAPDEGVASALVGYMWDRAALHLEGERI